MKRLFYFISLLLIACERTNICKKDIEAVFDSKQIGNCVITRIEENAQSELCYYSSLLQKLDKFRSQDKIATDTTAQTLLSIEPEKLFNLYQIVGSCQIAYSEPFDVIDDMDYLLDEYKNGLYPVWFYLGRAPNMESWKRTNPSTIENAKIREIYIRKQNIIEKRKPITSPENWT